MTEEQMKEYVVNGGKLFTITLIDTIRDGGTKIIKTTKDDYYINKDSKKFHSGYSPSEENLITDFLLIEYLTERIETYIKRCEEDVERNKNLLIEIKNKK
jgi:hypothetical protein